MRTSQTAKIVQLSERITTTEQGEVVREERERVMRMPQEPEYIKLYLQDLAHILEVPQGPQGLLMALVRKMDWEGMITLSPGSRDRIAAALQIKVHTLANYLSVLCDKEILRRVGRGEYEMNPHLMAKGDWSEILKRRATFKMTVTYKADGSKTVSGEVLAQQELPLSDAAD